MPALRPLVTVLTGGLLLTGVSAIAADTASARLDPCVAVAAPVDDGRISGTELVPVFVRDPAPAGGIPQGATVSVDGQTVGGSTDWQPVENSPCGNDAYRFLVAWDTTQTADGPHQLRATGTRWDFTSWPSFNSVTVSVDN